MRRGLALITPLVVLLVLAPAALATTYTVNDNGDAQDATPGDNTCATAGATCTLRAAIEEANAHAGADTIVFAPTAHAPQPATGYNGTDAVKGQTTIDGAGVVTITFAPAATGPLISIASDNSILRGVTLTGGASGPDVQLDGSDDALDGVTVNNAPGVGIYVHGTDATLTGPVVSNSGDAGVYLSGAAGTSISGAVVSAADADGIAVGADSAGTQVSGGTSHGNTGAGVSIAQQGVTVSRVVIYGNGGRPIALADGANGGISPPQSLRIGPRQPDGSLSLTGATATGGGIEMWSGDPFGPLAPSYFDTFGVTPGAFSYRFAGDPAPGATYALTVTANGTSEFSTVTVPADIISPEIVKARALSTTVVRVVPSEPLDPNSVQASDFALTMAGKDRQITAAAAPPDGTYVDLTSSGWQAGEAGYVQLTGAGVLTDAAGNANLNATRLRVAAAPGDFIAPIAGSLALQPSNICLTHGRGCRSPGTTIHFVTTEAGKALLVVQRGNKRVGTRLYGAVDAGANALRFNGRLSGRKLRAGRYRVLLYVQDQVGNVTDQPPIALMNVRRVSG